MNVEQVFIWPLPLIAVSLLSLGVYVLYRSRMTIRYSFFLLMLMGFLAIMMDLMILLSNTLDQALLFNDIQYIGNVAIPPLALVFVMRYIWLDRPGLRARFYPLFIIPAISLLVVWMDPWLHLFYTSVDLIPIWGFHILDYVAGPIFIIHVGYNVLMVAVCIALLLWYSQGAERTFRWNTRALAIALSIPLSSSLFIILSGWSSMTIYVESYGLLISALLAFWMVFRHELLDMTPLIHSKLLEEIPEAAIILDDLAMVREINRSASELTGIDPEDIGGLHFKDMFEALEIAEDVSFDAVVQGGVFECGSMMDGVWRTLEMHSTSLRDVRGLELGYLVTILDKTEVESLMESLRTANSKLNMMSSITRHDILNQATVVDGYAKMIADMDMSDRSNRYAERIQASIGRMIGLIEFTKTYQDLGVERPSWHSLRDEFDEATRLIDISGLDVRNDLEGHEILSDNLLRNVMVNLLDNTIRHGGDSVSSVMIGGDVEDDSLIITYSDDGVGVPDDLKERIFERDYGLHTGVGMFVSKEVLNLTDISIEEVGLEGEGAIFEIRVPRGRWR